ncbi:MAG TPA: DUF3105 domain-containing protein, partial [Iamia sp.]
MRALVAAIVLVATLAGCGDGGTGSCGPVRREPLDSRSVHVLPGADEPEYRTDPPTSGPHLPSPSTESVRDAPIAAPVQVGLLEEGNVLIQHVGLTDAERAEVEDLAGGGVIVAPAETLPDDAAVVATAWVTKQVCPSVDLDALQVFL